MNEKIDSLKGEMKKESSDRQSQIESLEGKINTLNENISKKFDLLIENLTKKNQDKEWFFHSKSSKIMQLT